MNARWKADLAVRILILLMCCGTPLSAQTAEGDLFALPVDAQTNWTIGITRLKEVNLSEENVYLASSLPLLLQEQLVGVKIHRFTAEEINAYRQAIINLELKKQIESLLVLQKKRDEDLFNETKDYRIRKIIADFDTSSAKIRTRIKFLRGLDPEKIPFKNEKEIMMKDVDGRLFPPPDFSALRYAGEINVDVIVWGSIEEIQGYLYCEFNFFERVMEKNIFQIKAAGTRDELFEIIMEKMTDCITALLGHEWASVLIDVDPVNSFIKQDGKLLGMGTVEIRYHDPGVLRVQISAPGFETVEREIALEKGTESVVEIKLTEKNEDFVLIQSIPPGASVYLDSLWAGTTPLILERQYMLSRLTLSLEGFHDEYFRLGPESPPAALIPLVKSVIDLGQFQDAKRDRFYSSLAAFLISLPFPVFSYNMALDYRSSNRIPEWEFFSVTYFWTFFISGALLVNSIIDLLRYVGTHEKPLG